MFAFGLAFLALFSVLSTVLGNEDPRRKTDPRDELSSGPVSATGESGWIAYPRGPGPRSGASFEFSPARARDSCHSPMGRPLGGERAPESLERIANQPPKANPGSFQEGQEPHFATNGPVVVN